MRRRQYLTAAGATTVAALAGCAELQTPDDNGDDTSDDGTTTDNGEETLVVSTYSSFLDAPSIGPGELVQQRFEEETGVNLEWESPDGQVDHYIQRAQDGASIDSDLYLGITTEDLVRVDEQLDDPLFASGLTIDGQDDIIDGLDFDPEDRAVPFNTGYICPVYDSTETDAPETFEELREADHAGNLIAQEPGSTVGLAFMLHTIYQYGEEEYLDFWADLQEGGATFLGSWADAYDAWMGGESPMVISYSTDQVFAAGDDRDLDKHQIQFLDDQAYANPEGMAVFEQADNPDLAEEFLEFMLTPEIQGEVAENNVVFPATETAELSEEYAELAHEPPEAVTFAYDDLVGNIDDWIDQWDREIAG